MSAEATTIQNASAGLRAALQDAETAFAANNPVSAARFERACAVMPGGNTRSALHFEPFPLTMQAGEGATLVDVDGHRYADFIGDHTAGLFGHSNRVIRDAMRRAMEEGMTLGTPNQYDAELATLICERFASVERVRFTNSGTEANLMALTAAREHTGRHNVMVFEGAYHGGVLLFGGSNPARNAPYPVVMAPYNNEQQTADLLGAHASELAAVLIEPMLGTGGAIPARRAFLQMLRDQCDRHGIVLIFDEVMTSRLSPGGLQQFWDITPDMTTFGKYIGGGVTFGAFGGRADIMDRFDPRRSDAIAHAGTFNNNVLTMAAGVAALGEVYTPDIAQAHTVRGEGFRADLNAVAGRAGVPVQATGIGSILHLHWQSGTISSPADLLPVAPELRRYFHLDMLGQGYYFSQKGFLTLSLPLSEADYAGFLAAFEQTLSRIRQRC